MTFFLFFFFFNFSSAPKSVKKKLIKLFFFFGVFAFCGLKFEKKKKKKKKKKIRVCVGHIGRTCWYAQNPKHLSVALGVSATNLIRNLRVSSKRWAHAWLRPLSHNTAAAAAAAVAVAAEYSLICHWWHQAILVGPLCKVYKVSSPCATRRLRINSNKLKKNKLIKL